MIPENKLPAVEKALQSAFGVRRFDSIQQITIGLSSALIFKMLLHGKPYLLRVIMRTDAMADPAHYFNSMKIAAEAGLGPSIYYLNAEDRISITDFIIAKPFPIPEARKQMADILRKLHALPKFPFRIKYFDTMEGFNEKFRAANIIPESVTKDLFELYTRIANVYPRNDETNLVSCHNDLKPENFIFDGVRPWLVDWEGAFLNDRYLDLVVVGNFVARNEAEEKEYLANYFQEPVDEYKHARYFLMQQMLHVYYFTMFMLVGSKGVPVDVDAIDKHDFRDFHERIWHGEINLLHNASKLQYAWVHMQQFLDNSKLQRMENALAVVGAVNNVL